MSDIRTDHPIVTKTFHDRESAERAYQDVQARGYSKDDIHVIMTDETRDRMYPDKEHAHHHHDRGDHALKGAGVGAGVGGAIGAVALGVIAAASSVAVPGLGLVIAGPLAGAAAGAAAGATAGGITGALVGAGLPEDRARVHEKEVKEGGVVIGVRPKHVEDARYFESEWQRARDNR